MKPIVKLLCTCAGADIHLLKKYPSEIMRYIAIGITVVFTGLFAALSGGYAFYKIFHNAVLAIVLGLTWGFMIFNLDRLIVMTIRKQDDFKKEFVVAIPRIVLAIIISLVVAKPLEVKIFEDRIAVVLAEREIAQLANAKQELDAIIGVGETENRLSDNKKAIEDAEKEMIDTPKTALFKNLQKQKKGFVIRLSKKDKELQHLRDRVSRFFSKQPPFFDSISQQFKRPTRSFHLAPEVWKQIEKTVTDRNKLIQEIEKIKRDSTVNDSLITDAIQKHQQSKQGKIDVLKAERDTVKVEQKNRGLIFHQKWKKYDSLNKIAFSDNFIAQIEALSHLTRYKSKSTTKMKKVQKKAFFALPFEEKIQDSLSTIPEGPSEITSSITRPQENRASFSPLQEEFSEENNSMFWMNIAIILLFIVIETSPIFVKLISKKGEYDLEKEANFNKHHSLIYSTSNMDILNDETYEELVVDLNKQSKEFRESMLKKLEDSLGYKMEEKILKAKKKKEFIKLIKEILRYDLKTWLENEQKNKKD